MGDKKKKRLWHLYISLVFILWYICYMWQYNVNFARFYYEFTLKYLLKKAFVPILCMAIMSCVRWSTNESAEENINDYYISFMLKDPPIETYQIKTYFDFCRLIWDRGRRSSKRHYYYCKCIQKLLQKARQKKLALYAW